MKILRHGSLKHTVVALAYFETEEETSSAAVQLHGYAFSPGHILEARIRGEINSDTELAQLQLPLAQKVNGVAMLMSEGMQSSEVPGEKKWHQQRVPQGWGVCDNRNSWWPDPQSWESQLTCSHAPDMSCLPSGSQPPEVWSQPPPPQDTPLPPHGALEAAVHFESTPIYMRNMATCSVMEMDVPALQQQWCSSPGWETEESVDLVRAPTVQNVPRPSVAPHLLAKRQRFTPALPSESPDVVLLCEESAQGMPTCWSVDEDDYGSESLDCEEKFYGGSWSQPSFNNENGCTRFSLRRNSRRRCC